MLHLYCSFVFFICIQIDSLLCYLINFAVLNFVALSVPQVHQSYNFQILIPFVGVTFFVTRVRLITFSQVTCFLMSVTGRNWKKWIWAISDHLAGIARVKKLEILIKVLRNKNYIFRSELCKILCRCMQGSY